MTSKNGDKILICNIFRRAPVTTATSIVALAFDKGVIIAGDTLGSYGSLARYRNCPRVLKINDNIILGAGGDYGDFQYVKDMIEQQMYVFHYKSYIQSLLATFILVLMKNA